MSISVTHAPPRNTALPSFGALGIGVLALGAIFWPECQAAVRVWSESTAYGHCFLVVPIAAYLLWDRRDSLRGLVPQPTPALALLGLPLPFAWLAAERLGIMEGRQLAAIGVLELLFLVMLGWRLFRAVAGPALYLFFLVPFGLFLTPALQSFTAWFIEAGLNLLGIPHFITDMTIEISAGTFYVAEACAGLRFLIASIAFGVFFALLNYRSPGRRVGFIAASIVVPIIANGFRALGIVVLGSIIGNAQAAATDHLIYGWFFFSFVTLLLVLAGLPFREAPAAAPGYAPLIAARARPGTAVLVLVLAAIGPAAAFAIDRNIAPARLAARPVLAAPPGCRIDPGVASLDAGRSTAEMVCGDRVWSITLQAVPGRSTGAAVVDTRRSLIGPVEDDEAVTAPLQGTPGWQTVLSHNPGMVVGSAAWIDGQPAAGGLVQRLNQARNSLLGASHDSMVMAVSLRPGHPMTATETTIALAELARFVAAQPALDTELARATNQGAAIH